jgi:hypothetical protein
MSPQEAQKAVATNLATYAGGGADAPAAKERVINIMAAQMKISHDDAAKKFDDAQAKLKQTRDQAIQTAKTTADASAAAASKTSLVGFGVLLLGGIVSAIGPFRGWSDTRVIRAYHSFARAQQMHKHRKSSRPTSSKAHSTTMTGSAAPASSFGGGLARSTRRIPTKERSSWPFTVNRTSSNIAPATPAGARSDTKDAGSARANVPCC